MQTFLPYPDYEETAAVMDIKRLGKQRVETLQIMTAIVENRGWVNHPAVRMWKGHEISLYRYQEAFCARWTDELGYIDTCLGKTQELVQKLDSQQGGLWSGTPNWLGYTPLHEGYQSNLIRKDAEFYRPIFGYDIPDDLPYYWPI